MESVPAAEALDGHKDRFDLGVFVGDLALDEELTRYSRSRCVISPSLLWFCDSEACSPCSTAASDDESLEGLQQELDDCKDDQVSAFCCYSRAHDFLRDAMQ